MSTFLNLSDAALRLVDDTAQAVLDSHTAPTAEALEAALEVVAACRIERDARNADQAFAASCQRISVAPSAVELARKTVDLARKIIAALDTERDNEVRESANRAGNDEGNRMARLDGIASVTIKVDGPGVDSAERERGWHDGWHGTPGFVTSEAYRDAYRFGQARHACETKAARRETRKRLGARVWSQTKHGITAWSWAVAGASGTRTTKAEALSAIDRIVDVILVEEAR